MCSAASQASEPDLEQEQRFGDSVFAAVDTLHQHLRTREGLRENLDAVASPHARRALLQMREQQRDDLAVLTEPFFGCISRRDHRGVLYVGRLLVRRQQALMSPQELEDDDLLVVSWKAPAAAAFYRARPGRSAGLELKRSYTWQERQLQDVQQETYSAQEDGDDAVGNLSLQDALLNDLERAREPLMRDIVATIQADQYDLLERPARGVLVIQGAPGTGKTAVALHRLSFLAYTYPDVRKRGLLLLGPNERFLRYVAGVLPGLGDDEVIHTIVSGLVPEYTINTSKRPWRQLLGNRAMARVLRADVMARLRPLPRDARVQLGDVPMRLTPPRANEMLETVGAAPTWAAARTELRRLIAADLAEQYLDAAGAALAASEFRDPEQALLDSPALERVVSQLAPALSAEEVLEASARVISRSGSLSSAVTCARPCRSSHASSASRLTT